MRDREYPCSVDIVGQPRTNQCRLSRSGQECHEQPAGSTLAVLAAGALGLPPPVTTVASVAQMQPRIFLLATVHSRNSYCHCTRYAAARIRLSGSSRK